MARGTAPRVQGVDVLERVGGTRAQVHRGVLRASGRVVVVKHAPAGEPTTRAGLRREAAVLGRVRHPALQQLLDVHDDEGGTSLVLARHVGGDLAAHLRDHGPLAAAAVAAVGARVARALAALHAADVVHRDVRAANVLLDAGGRAVLADLDHALDPASPPLALDTEVVGSRGHLDPRLLAGEPADEASDLHALAVTLWHAVTGTLPPPAGVRDADPGAPRPGLPIDVDPALVDVLQDVMDGQVDDARAVADRLADLAGDVSGVPPAAAVGPIAGLSAPVLQRAGGGADTADGLAAAWGGDAGTERFGAAGLPAVRRLRGRLPRWHVLVAVAGLALVPVTVVVGGWVARDGRSVAEVSAPSGHPPTVTTTATPPAVAGGAATPGNDDSGVPGRGVDAPAPAAPDAPPPPLPTPELEQVSAPAPCPGVTVTPGTVLADLDGTGCGLPLSHDPDEAVLTAHDGSRWALGQPGDVLLVGDWDGDGRWSPGLHRPATGEVLLFPPLGDVEVTSEPAQLWPAGGRAVVVAADGHHAVVVEPRAG